MCLHLPVAGSFQSHQQNKCLPLLLFILCFSEYSTVELLEQVELLCHCWKHQRGLTCEQSLKGTSLVFIEDFVNFITDFICATCQLNAHKLQQKSYHISVTRTTQITVVPMELLVGAVLSVSCFHDPIFLSVEHNLMEMCVFFKSSVRQLKITLNMHSSKHPLKSNTEGYGCKMYQIHSIDSITLIPSGRKLYNLQFVVTSGYAFIFQCQYHQKSLLEQTPDFKSQSKKVG